jgi:hypothetical protein
MLPTNDGHIGLVHNDSLIASDNGGHLDTLRLPVQVTVAQAGTYQLAVDVAAGSSTVASAGGAATLDAGTHDITVDVPLSRLLAGNAPSGPFRIVKGTLTRGTSGRALVARASDLGTTASYDLDTFAPAAAVLSRLTATSADHSGDGIFDTIDVTGAASVATGGEYQFAATLTGPDHTILQSITQPLTLAAGRHPVSLHIEGTLVGAAGSGTYELSNITLTGRGQKASTQPLIIGPLDASRWIGATPNAATLRRLWDRAENAGAIHRFGLYVSEANRVDRVVKAESTADAETAAAQLETFIADVASSTVIDAAWQRRVYDYAVSLRSQGVK